MRIGRTGEVQLKMLQLDVTLIALSSRLEADVVRVHARRWLTDSRQRLQIRNRDAIRFAVCDKALIEFWNRSYMMRIVEWRDGADWLAGIEIDHITGAEAVRIAVSRQIISTGGAADLNFAENVIAKRV